MRLFSSRIITITILAACSLFIFRVVSGADSPMPANSGSVQGSDILNVLVALVVILLAAKIGGDFFERFHQPAVLGELVTGILIGNIHLIGLNFMEPFKYDVSLETLAELGVIILLFEVGLETTVRKMLKVGLTSLSVALVGVAVPFFLGWMVANWFLPESSTLVHIFVGATLTATSVGITARVLKDIGKLHTNEAQIILGAAVIDDILGLMILGVVAGIISAASSGAAEISNVRAILWITTKAVLFIVGAVIIGGFLLPHYFKFGSKLKTPGVLLLFSLLICFLLAFIAGKIGLAPIVGAFAAGLILENVHFRDFDDRGEHKLKEMLAPIAVFLVPIFFVRMGMLIDLTTFTQVHILGFAAALTIAAIVGKQICALAIFEKGINRLAIGFGMIPRGEVGLIFAGIGAKLMLDGEPVIEPGTYSAVVIMVIVTTLVMPPLQKYAMLNKRAQAIS